jgi:hypothetical protein
MRPFGSPQCTYNGVAHDNLFSINRLSIPSEHLFHPNLEQKRHHKNISWPILADCLTAGLAKTGGLAADLLYRVMKRLCSLIALAFRTFHRVYGLLEFQSCTEFRLMILIY